jgi:hypothetical protein
VNEHHGMSRFLTTILRRRELDPRSREFSPQRNFQPGRHPHHRDNQGPEMTSLNRTAIAKRLVQGLAATALITGLAIGSAATAAATPYNRDGYYRCINNGGYIDVCCIQNDGEVIYDQEGHPWTCWEPLKEAENVPQEPGDTTTPPVLQNPPAQPSNPVIPVPRGPNSGTLAP